MLLICKAIAIYIVKEKKRKNRDKRQKVKSDEDKSDNGGDNGNNNNINNNNNNIYHGPRIGTNQIKHRKENLLNCCLLYLYNNFEIQGGIHISLYT